MKKDDCIFCKLANGQIPTRSIYEDEDFKVILDNGPATRGHALILPKEHSDNIFQLPEETCCKIMGLAKRLGSEMVNALQADGLNVVQNNGEAAGQTVMHYHLHLIPRYKEDGQHILWNPTEPSDTELDEVWEKLNNL